MCNKFRVFISKKTENQKKKSRLNLMFSGGFLKFEKKFSPIVILEI